MKIDSESARKPNEMGAAELLDALQAQDEALCTGMSVQERLQMANDEAYSNFISQNVKNLTTRANLMYPEADVRLVDFSDGPDLYRATVAELAT